MTSSTPQAGGSADTDTDTDTTEALAVVEGGPGTAPPHAEAPHGSGAADAAPGRGPRVASGTATASSPEAAAVGGRRPRRARLVLRRIDPWSVAKLTFVISIALLVVFVVAVSALYAILDLLGVFDTVNETVQNLTSEESGSGGGLEIVFSAGRVLGGATLLGGVYVVLVTALATLGALLYNVCADLAGGVEVTLTEPS